jgi:hypothetical protein
LIAVALSGYGLYRARYVPATLVGQPVPLLLIGFLVKRGLGAPETPDETTSTRTRRSG